VGHYSLRWGPFTVVASVLMVATAAGQPAPTGRWAGGRQDQASHPLSSVREHNPRIEVFGGYNYSPEWDRFKVGSQSGHGWAATATFWTSRYAGWFVDFDTQDWTDRGDLDATDLSRLQCPGHTGCVLRGDEHISLRYLAGGVAFRAMTGPVTVFGFADFEKQRSRYSEKDIARVGLADDAEFVAAIGTKHYPFYSRPYIFDTWDVPLERHGDNIVGRARVAAASASAWGFGVGGGADLWLNRYVGVRLLQVSYSLGGYGEGPGRELRLKTGLVLGFP